MDPMHSETEASGDRPGAQENRAGFALLQGVISEEVGLAVRLKLAGYDEAWKRRDDGITYAVDKGDQELWERLEKELKEIERKMWSLRSAGPNRGEVLRQAVRYFEASAAQGDPEGMWNLGWRLWLGEGVVQNQADARLWWERAASCGHEAAAAKLEELKRSEAPR
jgi:TPR repeat protein